MHGLSEKTGYKHFIQLKANGQCPDRKRFWGLVLGFCCWLVGFFCGLFACLLVVLFVWGFDGVFCGGCFGFVWVWRFFMYTARMWLLTWGKKKTPQKQRKSETSSIAHSDCKSRAAELKPSMIKWEVLNLKMVCTKHFPCWSCDKIHKYSFWRKNPNNPLISSYSD